MALVYKDINIQVNFGVGPTMFVGQFTTVMTENGGSRLLVTFPQSYVDYSKSMDILYTSGDGETVIENYLLDYDSDLDKYFFILERKFTFGKKVYLQFRATYADGQEIVDPYKLSISFKDAIKKDFTE